MDWSFLENKEWEPLDIGSGKDYPSNALSNFAPHPFVIDGVECNSMEGKLQSGANSIIFKTKSALHFL